MRAKSRSPRPTTTAASRLLVIEWNLEGHPLAFGSGMGPEVYVPILPLALGDGIRALTYTATDKAGNVATSSNDVKIDTRGPVTDGAAGWVNGLVPYELTATDQVPGSGVAATVYRVDQATPWSINEAGVVAPTLMTEITLSGGQASEHTIDFASVDAALPFWFDADDWADHDRRSRVASSATGSSTSSTSSRPARPTRAVP